VLGFSFILFKGQRHSRGLNWGAFCGLKPKRRFRVLRDFGVSLVFLWFWRGGVKMSQSLEFGRVEHTLVSNLEDGHGDAAQLGLRGGGV
jgi:hypothetical protein